MMREKVEEILSRTNVAAEEIDALLAEFERVQARLAALELKLGDVHCDATYYASRCAELGRVQDELVDALELFVKDHECAYPRDEPRSLTAARAALAEVNEPAAPSKPTSCEWAPAEDPDYGHWQGACGAEWQFNDAGPVENGMRFCPKCGKPVSVQQPEGGDK